MKQHPTKRRQKDRPKKYRNYEQRRKNGGKLFMARFKFILKMISS